MSPSSHLYLTPISLQLPPFGVREGSVPTFVSDEIEAHLGIFQSVQVSPGPFEPSLDRTGIASRVGSGVLELQRRPVSFAA